MKTYEMIALAQENGKTYISCDMRCNKEKGFYDKHGCEWPANSFKTLNQFININDWQELKEISKLTEDEKVILRNVDKEYKYIARDGDDKLYFYINKPYKDNGSWSGSDATSIFDHLFKFIKWEDDEPYSIQELLEENKENPKTATPISKDGSNIKIKKEGK